MALANYEAEQRRLGNIAAADDAKKLLEAHRDLPAVEVTPSGVVMPNEQTRARIESFRPRMRIYALSGTRYRDQRYGGMGYRDLALRDKPEWKDLLQERARNTWVAFTPYPLGGIDINQAPDKAQQDIEASLAKYTVELEEKTGLDDIEAVQGTLTDYVELGAQFMARAGDFLGNYPARPLEEILTSTKLGGSSAVIRFHSETWAHTIETRESDNRDLERLTAGASDFADGFKSRYVLLPLIVPKES